MSRCYVQLGRYGDVMNIIPLLWERARVAERPHLLVGHEFDTILEGVSYVCPRTWDGDWEDLQGAVAWAGENFDEVFVTQVHSKNYVHNYQCDSYAKDAWAQIGRGDWGSLPLVFDLRDPRRERRLLERLGLADSTRHLIVVSRKGGSSPYEAGEALSNIIRDKFDSDQCDVVDISDLKAERIYDLLGLFDKANALVTIDTSTLHLAHASKVAVFALLSDGHNGWGATPPYPGQVWRCQYKDAHARIDEMIDRLEETVFTPPFQRTLHHVWSEWKRDPESERRHRIAAGTWAREWNLEDEGGRLWRTYPVCYSQRTSVSMGDPRPMPFIRDLVDVAMRHARENDLIVLTNDDVSFAPGLTETLMNFKHPCGWAHRYDFKSINREVSTVGLANGHKYPGVDLVAFTPRWWREAKFPDMLLGRERWDLVIKSAMRLTGGIEIPVACAHEQHASFWSSENNENTNPGNLWNRKKAEEWFHSKGLQVP